MFQRPPDFTVNVEGVTYLRRWHLLPRNNWFNVYLHNMVHDDDPTALHDHPYVNLSIVWKGGYCEITAKDPLSYFDLDIYAHPVASGYSAARQKQQAKRYQPPWNAVWRGPGSIIFRRSTDAHRLELDAPDGKDAMTSNRKPSWSLFVTGPRRRVWGFWLPTGWVQYTDYVNVKDGISAKRP
jgi:hypothetical protein